MARWHGEKAQRSSDSELSFIFQLLSRLRVVFLCVFELLRFAWRRSLSSSQKCFVNGLVKASILFSLTYEILVYIYIYIYIYIVHILLNIELLNFENKKPTYNFKKRSKLNFLNLVDDMR